MAINITHLRSFWAVATCGGFSAASRWLNVSQPALTRQIKELEEGYGVVLFDRNTSSIELTPEGQALFPITARIFEAADEAETFLKLHRHGDVRLAAVTTDITTRLISALQSLNPDLHLIVSIGTSRTVYEALLARECEIGVLSLNDDNPSISALEIGRFPLLAILPPGHPLIGRQEVSLHEIAEGKIITGSSAAQSRQRLEQAARSHGVTVDITQEIDGYEMVGELVRLGLGVGVIGYTGIVERTMPNVVTIRECADAIPVHFACLTVNRRVRLIDHLFNVVRSALVEGANPAFQFSGR